MSRGRASAPLVKSGAKQVILQMTSSESLGIQLFSNGCRFKIGCTENFKGSAGTPPFGNVGPFPKNLPRIDKRCFRKRHVGGWHHPFETRFTPGHMPAPPDHGKNSRSHPRAKTRLKRRAISPMVRPCRMGRDAGPTNENNSGERRFPSRIFPPRDWAGPEQQPFSETGSGFHTKKHGGREGVYPCPHILKVHDQRVDEIKHFGIRGSWIGRKG